MTVTKADLENAKKIVDVDLSEWMSGDNGLAHVRAVSAEDGMAISALAQKTKEDSAGQNRIRLRWVIVSLCDDKGELLFDDSLESESFLAKRPSRMLDIICEAAMRVNGVGEDAKEDAIKN